jgi:type VI protein secretion system component VasK
MKTVALAFGVVASLLGGFWLLQGLDIVHVRPMLCFSDCAPVRGASPKWAMIGAVLLGIGVFAVWWSRKRKFKRATTASDQAK